MARRLRNWIDSWLEYTNDTEPPYLYRKWTAISTIASCMQRKCTFPWGHDTLYPNMYIILVGPSATRKGTALAPARKMLNRIGIQLSADAGSIQAIIESLTEAGKVDLVSENGVLVDNGQINHCSLTVFAAELSVFLGTGDLDFMMYFCDWFDCADVWTYRTKARGVETINNLWVNMIGATTPETLRTTIPTELIGTGLASRIVFIYETRKGKPVPIPQLTPEKLKLQDDLEHDLNQIFSLAGEYKPTQSFLKAYETWYLDQEKNPRFTDKRFEGYQGRRSVHVRKLSMIVAASQGDYFELDAMHFAEALTYLEEAEIKMSRALTGIGASQLAQVQNEILQFIARRKELQVYEIAQTFYEDITIDDLTKIIEILHTGKIINYVPNKDNPSASTITYVYQSKKRKEQETRMIQETIHDYHKN